MAAIFMKLPYPVLLWILKKNLLSRLPVKGVSFSGSILITTKISLDQPFQHLLHFNYVLEQPALVSRELYFIHSLQRIVGWKQQLQFCRKEEFADIFQIFQWIFLKTFGDKSNLVLCTYLKNSCSNFPKPGFLVPYTTKYWRVLIGQKTVIACLKLISGRVA